VQRGFRNELMEDNFTVSHQSGGSATSYDTESYPERR